MATLTVAEITRLPGKIPRKRDSNLGDRPGATNGSWHTANHHAGRAGLPYMAAVTVAEI